MTYAAPDAGYKQPARICFRILDEAGRSLLGGGGRTCRSMLHDFGMPLFSTTTLPFTALGFLLLFGGCG